MFILHRSSLTVQPFTSVANPAGFSDWPNIRLV